MGIDIFPLDYLPDDPELSSLQQYLVQKIVFCVRNWEKTNEITREENVKEIESLCSTHIARDANILRTLIQLSDSIRALYQENDGNDIAKDGFWFTNDRQIATQKNGLLRRLPSHSKILWLLCQNSMTRSLPTATVITETRS